MNNTDQAFIEAYRERRDESSDPNVRVLKAADMAKVVGANSPIELSFESPSKNIVLQSAPAQKGLPLNRKHSRHKNPPAPHAADIKGMAETTAVATGSSLQNAIATGNDLATDTAIANSKLADALPPEPTSGSDVPQPMTPTPKVEATKPEVAPVEAEPTTTEKPREVSEPAVSEQPAESTEKAIEPKAEPELDPMWEVDSFEWSQVCQRIHEAGAKVLPNLQWVEACEPGVLAVGSIRRQSGATTAAICLARHVASTGKNVLVVDSHFQHAQVAEQLGVKAPACWREKLIADGPLAKATITSIADRLTILPLASNERLQGSQCEQVQQAISEAAKSYDLTIVDIGVIDNESPLGGGDSCFGGVLVVRDLRHDDEKAVAKALQTAKTIGDNIAVIENFAE